MSVRAFRLSVGIACLLSGGGLVAKVKPDKTSSKASDKKTAAPPQVIPFHDKRIKTDVGHAAVDVSYPIFDHPDPAARAAIAVAVEREMGPLTTLDVKEGDEGYIDLSCTVAAATTGLLSFVCRWMQDVSRIADRERGIGGAPAEDSVESFLFLLDGAQVRKGTLGELFKDPKRARPIVLQKLQAALVEPCPELKLVPDATLDAFTVGDEGVKFYFRMAAFGDTGSSACGNEVALTWDDLKGLLRPGGLFERLAP